MKIILKLLLIFFIAPVYAVDPFQTIENSFNSTSLENSMNPWEVNFTQEKWRVNIENCYDRNVNQEAKKAVIELLSKNGQVVSGLSAREVGMQLDFYCSHVLSLADQVGIKLTIAPLNASNPQVKSRIDFIQSCYSFRREGFTNDFRNTIELFIRASREGLGKDKNLPISGQEILMTYVGMCGALFSYDATIPVHISFTINAENQLSKNSSRQFSAEEEAFIEKMVEEMRKEGSSTKKTDDKDLPFYLLNSGGHNGQAANQ